MTKLTERGPLGLSLRPLRHPGMHTGWAFQWSTARPVHAYGTAPAGWCDGVWCRRRIGFSGRNPFCQTRLGAGERWQHPSAPDLAPRGPYARAGVVTFKVAELCVRHAQGSRAGSGAGHEDLWIPGQVRQENPKSPGFLPRPKTRVYSVYSGAFRQHYVTRKVNADPCLVVL